MINSLAIFCGSSKGSHDSYEQTALQLANYLVDHDITMVYGGGSVGLMGVLADEMMRRGGQVIGVITQKLLEWEVGHNSITQLHVVNTMHERKAKMAALAYGFIALPGGIGTLEEIIEVYTWLQLGYHHKPCGFLNVNNYFEHLIRFFDHMESEQFLKPNIRDGLIIEDKIDMLMDRFKTFEFENDDPGSKVD
ncbi:MAG: TIGR00730 family Rossman fold protein [Cyclobacteriaceae bacterium]